MLRFENVSKCYGRVEAVRNLSLEVLPGELFGFLGPNGAGKTTTIKMAAGILKPSAGRVIVAGHDIYVQGPLARKVIGYVPDAPYLYDKLTGREFMEFIADLYGVNGAKRRVRTEELLELFELSEYQDRLIESYSHGMRQKLVMASVLLHDPQVILLDEPTAAMDPKSARLVKDILRALCKRGVTVFMSTHIMEIAERMCDRIGIIHRGELVALGTVEALRQRRGEGSLEDIFLAITGGSRHGDLIRALNGGNAL